MWPPLYSGHSEESLSMLYTSNQDTLTGPKGGRIRGNSYVLVCINWSETHHTGNLSHRGLFSYAAAFIYSYAVIACGSLFGYPTITSGHAAYIVLARNRHDRFYSVCLLFVDLALDVCFYRHHLLHTSKDRFQLASDREVKGQRRTRFILHVYTYTVKKKEILTDTNRTNLNHAFSTQDLSNRSESAFVSNRGKKSWH